MIDELMLTLSEVSRVLIPILSVLALVFLIVLLHRLIKIVKSLEVTVEKVNSTIDITTEKIEMLDEPLKTIIGVSTTVDMVNTSAVGAASKAVEYVIKNSDSVLNWSKDFFAKGSKTEVNEEEDFGVYE